MMDDKDLHIEALKALAQKMHSKMAEGDMAGDATPEDKSETALQELGDAGKAMADDAMEQKQGEMGPGQDDGVKVASLGDDVRGFMKPKKKPMQPGTKVVMGELTSRKPMAPLNPAGVESIANAFSGKKKKSFFGK